MDIEKSQHHDIVVGTGEGLTSFFVPGDIDRAFRENEFAVTEMIEILTDIARSNQMRTIQRRDGTIIEEPVASPKDRIAALLMLDKKAKEAMVLGGLIQQERLQLKKVGADGTTAEYNAEGMRLTQEGSSRLKSTLALLQGASESKSDEVIDVEVIDGPKNDGGDVPPKQSRPVSGRRSECPDPGPVPTGGSPGDESRGNRSGGDGLRSGVHVGKRPDPSPTRGKGEADDQGTVGGAEDERSTGLPVECGRGGEGEGTGGEGQRDVAGHQCNPGPPKRPAIPGEQSAKRTNWWEPGIPRRSPDSDPGSIRDCDTAESTLDRLRRIDRAREQAALASASYVERRAKDQRAADLKPGDGPRSSD